MNIVLLLQMIHEPMSELYVYETHLRLKNERKIMTQSVVRLVKRANATLALVLITTLDITIISKRLKNLKALSVKNASPGF